MAQLAAWAELCSIQARVTEIHNGGHLRKASAQIMQDLSVLDEELRTWREELPDYLRLFPDADAGRPGPVYALQLACLATAIVLHRPLAGLRVIAASLTEARECERRLGTMHRYLERNAVAQLLRLERY
jgi:hypothetical protein